MAKIRVNELAKELGVRNQDVMALLNRADDEEISAVTLLSADEEKSIRSRLGGSGAARGQKAAASPDSAAAGQGGAPASSSAGQTENRQSARKKRNISVVFNRSSDDRRRAGGQRPQGAGRPAPQGNGEGGQRPRKMSRRLMESEREQKEKQREQERAAAEQEAAQRKAAEEEQEAARAAAERKAAAEQAEQAREDAAAAQRMTPAGEQVQTASPAQEKPAEKSQAPDAEKKAASKSAPQQEAAQADGGKSVQDTEQPKGPVVRTNILADLQRQEEERKKAAAARKQQQKARTERGSKESSGRTGERQTQGNRKDGSGAGRSGSQGQGRSTAGGTSRTRSKDAARPSGGSTRPQQSAAKSGGKSAVFNSDASSKGSARKGQDNKNKQQGDYKKDKRRGTRLDKSEKTFSLEKQSSHKKQHKTPQRTNEAGEEIRTITIPDTLTLKELADLLKIAPNALVKKLLLAGKMMTLNQEMTFEEAEEIALEYNCIAEHEEKVDLIEELLKEEEENEADLVTRPPVVCVMGHVDHGKTSLLDAIRHTHHIDTEAGGITQAIGAYVVDVGDRKITFLDTPGHEAFTAMRMRGANSTDIAVLVVAADDGVMPQTVEAINHAKAAGIDLIVAINKIDKPDANIDRVKQELSEYQLIPEDWGGSTVFCNISAKTGEGIDELLEMILLSADVLELKANPNRKARGLVIESRLDKGKGVVATVLVQKGTLKVGEPIAAGESYGRVRAMTDEDGHPVKSAGPSVPVEIQGLSTVPNAGEIFVALDSEKEARAFAQTFISEGRNKLLAETKSRMSLDDLFEQIQAGNVKELNIIIKADVQGSAEAIKTSLLKLSNDEVVVKVIHCGVGAINESDVVLAATSNALIIGFNVAPDASAKSTAESEKVEIKLYDVIYNAIDDVERAMKGMLDPIYEEKITGHAQIRMIYKASGVGNIAGSYVLDGVVQRDSKVRLQRNEEVIYEGEIASLKRYKDDVKEVKAGFECGIVISGFDRIAEDDIIEAYTMVEVPRT